MFKFIHAADVHLDSARAGVLRDEGEGAVEIQQPTRRAFENLVNLAIDEQVAFVLIAGDLYDGNWPDFHTGLFFLDQVARLDEAGIRVFLVRGNHDAANVMTRTLNWSRVSGLKMFAEDEPETVVLEELGVAIHGRSFADRAVKEDLAGGYPPPVPGMFNIGLLHTAATYAGSEHDPYAPCTVETLLGKNYDYWALGHIHKRQDLRRRDDEPPLMFSGNLQGRHVRETGAKGCLLVTVEDGHCRDIQFRAVDVVRWEWCVVDVHGTADPHEVIDRVTARLSDVVDGSEGRPVIARVELQGCTPAQRAWAAEPRRWGAELRRATLQLGRRRLWIERILRRMTSPEDDPAVGLQEGPLEELDALIAVMAEDPAFAHALKETLKPLVDKLPADVTEGDPSLSFSGETQLTELITDARALLLERIRAMDEKR